MKSKLLLILTVLMMSFAGSSGVKAVDLGPPPDQPLPPGFDIPIPAYDGPFKNILLSIIGNNASGLENGLNNYLGKVTNQALSPQEIMELQQLLNKENQTYYIMANMLRNTNNTLLATLTDNFQTYYNPPPSVPPGDPTPTPEPSSIILGLLGISGAIGLRRNKK